MNAGAFGALAGHAAHRAGGARVAWLAAFAGFAAAAAAAQLPVGEAADRGLIAAGAGLAVTGAVAGIGLALGAALALTRTPELAPIAAAPIGRGLLAFATLAGIAAATTAAAAAGTAGTLAGTTLFAGTGRPMQEWSAPVSVDGATARGDARWTTGADQPVTILLTHRHLGGPLRVRLRPRLRVARSEVAPFEQLPPTPLELWLVGQDAGRLPTRLPTPQGNAWSKGRLHTTFEAPAGAVTLQVRPAVPGVRIGLSDGDVGVQQKDSALGVVVIRAWAGLVAPLALIALVAAFTSAFCSRGVSAAAGLAASLSLGLAPLARASLGELGRLEGLSAILRPLAAALLAVIPGPAGGIEAVLAGETLAWAAVGASVVGHLPWVAILVIGSWWVVRNRDW